MSADPAPTETPADDIYAICLLQGGTVYRDEFKGVLEKKYGDRAYRIGVGVWLVRTRHNLVDRHVFAREIHPHTGSLEFLVFRFQDNGFAVHADLRDKLAHWYLDHVCEVAQKWR